MKLKYLLFLVPFVFMQAQDFTQDTSLKKIPDAKPQEFKFIGYWFTRATASDIAPTNELLRGQIIGRLFGPNTTNTSPKTSSFFEQRFVPMFIYSPNILDGVATFRGLFKIDMTWGDAAYGVGGNNGGSINAGQVNLQTLMANVDIRPKRDAEWNVVVGLQRIFDNVRDPNITAISTFQSSAYRLSYFGTQGVGISLFGLVNPTTAFKFGYYQFYENQIQENDDVAFWMFDAESRVHPLIELGADLWYLYDRGKNSGGVSVLGQGLNSSLAEYNGGVRLSFPTSRYEADLFWAGVHSSYNREFLAGRFWADAYAMANFGSIDTVNGTDFSTGKYADMFGLALNASLNYKYGMTNNDRISIEAQFTTGDANGAADGTVSSVITGNEWGSPTGIYSSHKALLLFPDAQVVNRYYSAVHDISNMGFGVTAGFLSFYKDLIPNKLNAKLGLATALSNVSPAGGQKYMGTEINAEIKYNVKVFLTIGLSAGYLKLGDFFKSPVVKYDRSTSMPKDPFVVFATLNWLMF